MCLALCQEQGFILFVFLAALGLHCFVWAFSLWRAGATLHCNAWASHCWGFSCGGAWAIGHLGFSRSGAQA